MIRMIKNALKFEFLLFSSVMTILPFVFIPSLPDQILPPQLTFLSVVTMSLSFWIIFDKSSRDTLHNTLRKPAILFWMIFLIISSVSLAFASNITEGLFELVKTFQVLMLLILTLTVLSVCKVDLMIINKLATITSLIIIVTGAIQYLNFASLRSGAELYQSLYKVTGVFGHKNELSVALFLLMPWLVFGLVGLKGAWRWFTAVIFLSMLMMIAGLQTRSVWLGILFSFICFSVLFFLYFRNHATAFIRQHSRKSFLVLISLLLAISTVIVNYNNSLRSGSVFSYQVGGILNVNEVRNLQRFSIWKSTLDLFVENPVVGVGVGNWKIEIPRYQQDYLVKRSGQDAERAVFFQTWLRPHNDFLWILAERGPFGLLSYLLFFSAVGFAGTRVLKSSAKPENKWIVTLLLSSLAGYFVIAFFNFPNERVSHQVILMISSAFILHLGSPVSVAKAFTDIRMSKLINLLIITGLIFSLVYGILLVRSGFYHSMALHPVNQAHPKKMLIYYEKAATPLHQLDVFGIPFKYYTGIIHERAGNLKDAEKDFLEAQEQHPNHYRITESLGTLYLKAGRIDLAIPYLQSSLEIFPFNNAALMKLARAYYLQNNYDMAYQTLLGCIKTAEIPGYETALKKAKNHLDLAGN